MLNTDNNVQALQKAAFSIEALGSIAHSLAFIQRCITSRDFDIDERYVARLQRTHMLIGDIKDDLLFLEDVIDRESREPHKQ